MTFLVVAAAVLTANLLTAAIVGAYFTRDRHIRLAAFGSVIVAAVIIFYGVNTISEDAAAKHYALSVPAQ